MEEEAQGTPLTILLGLSTFVLVIAANMAAHNNSLMETNSTGLRSYAPVETSTFTRTDVEFSLNKTLIHGWLYIPKKAFQNRKRAPIVILAHGFGGQKDMGLTLYAEEFAAQGFAAMVFDYRTFGASGGQPRHWVSPSRHIEDWIAAVSYVQENLAATVDTKRIFLWGTSFSGGHVLVVASKLQESIAGVISQSPFLDGRAAAVRNVQKRSIKESLLFLGAAVLDYVNGWLGLPAAYVKLVGIKGKDVAFMPLSPEELQAYYAKHPKTYIGPGWENKARARVIHELSSYRPIAWVSSVRCPILFIAATKDMLCPLDDVRAAAAVARRRDLGELHEINATHFELYLGKPFEKSMSRTVRFLQDNSVDK